ncbi:MAG TPA: hypothetical protein VK420_04600 [Longimicrobium sp.]|nr:hypothetical protein [Longimicrobium sp.]
MPSVPSITTWTRLEPDCRNDGMDEGLEARVHDPLWLLGRQWQMGEFKAEDAGTAVGATTRVEASRLSRYAPGAPFRATPSAAQDYDVGRLPLETLVEREARPSPERAMRQHAEAGQHFLRLLAAHGGAAYRDGFIGAFPLLPPARETLDTFDPDGLRFLRVLAGRTVDGSRLYLQAHDWVRPGGAPALPAGLVKPEDQAKVLAACAAWVAWYETLVSTPPGADVPGSAAPNAGRPRISGPSGMGNTTPGAPPKAEHPVIGASPAEDNRAWLQDRMEYAFSVSAATPTATAPDKELVLSCPEYADGALDWYAFDHAAAGVTLGATGKCESITTTVMPSPVSYPGMPATRFWEFEDAHVDFGGLEAGPRDLTRLLLTEFALIYGNDWLLLPVDLPVGTVCRVSLEVRDSFGVKVSVPHYTEVDKDDTQWRMFHLSGAGEPVLFLPPSLAESLHGPNLEEVLFARDELANLAWAIERVVEGPAGRPVDRMEQWALDPKRAREDAVPRVAPGAELVYRLATPVPDPWIPLVPELSRTGTMQLRRGASTRMGAGNTVEKVKPVGRLLASDKLVVQEEEVPSEGARVTRAYQYARWLDGSTHLWGSRRKVPGRGELSSGLRFDVVSPAPNPGTEG